MTKLKKYRVPVALTTDVVYIVEAESKEEAKDRVENWDYDSVEESPDMARSNIDDLSLDDIEEVTA